MTPEELGSDLRETVREMSRMTNKILILGIILILAILAALHVLWHCQISLIGGVKKSVILSSSFLHFPTASPTLGLFIFDNMLIGGMQDAPIPKRRVRYTRDLGQSVSHVCSFWGLKLDFYVAHYRGIGRSHWLESTLPSGVMK